MSPKDVGLRPLEWREISVEGAIVRRRLLEVPVKVVPPACDGALIITGHWKGDLDVQIMLQVIRGTREENIARLCWNRQHQGDLHWHWYASPNGAETRESVAAPPGNVDHETMLWDVFVPCLQLVNVQRGM